MTQTIDDIEHMFASEGPAAQPRFARMARMTDLAARLRDLHRPGDPLLLANASRNPPALGFAALGYPAIATTSGGVARALGFEDGQAGPVSRDERRGRADRRGGRCP